MRSAIFLSNLILLCLLGMDRAEAAGEEWIFLKDGRVGWGNPAGDLVSVRLPGGTVEQLAKDKINFSRSKERIDKTVDAMLTLLSDGRTYTGCVERFKAMDIALVPKAIEFLKWPDARFRIAALFALQYGWSKEAQVNPRQYQLGPGVLMRNFNDCEAGDPAAAPGVGAALPPAGRARAAH